LAEEPIKLSDWLEEVAASLSYNDYCVKSFSPSLQAFVTQPHPQKLTKWQQEPRVLLAARQVPASAVFYQTMSEKELLVGSGVAAQLRPELPVELYYLPLLNN